MNTGFLISGAAALAAMVLVACYPDTNDEGSTSDLTGASTVETQDPLEGAYVKQGGTPVHFVFKRGETEDDDNTFFGDIKADDGAVSRAKGKIAVSRDNLGTKFTLTLSGAKAAPKTAAKDTTPTIAGDAGAPADKPEDTRSLAEQAFNGTMHYLKIGKNSTILVRGDANGKTAHYKKFKSWCAEAADCDKSVQNTGLDCEAVKCTSKSACACE